MSIGLHNIFSILWPKISAIEIHCRTFKYVKLRFLIYLYTCNLAYPFTIIISKNLFYLNDKCISKFGSDTMNGLHIYTKILKTIFFIFDSFFNDLVALEFIFNNIEVLVLYMYIDSFLILVCMCIIDRLSTCLRLKHCIHVHVHHI